MCLIERLINMKCKIEKFKTEEKANRVVLVKQLKRGKQEVDIVESMNHTFAKNVVIGMWG